MSELDVSEFQSQARDVNSNSITELVKSYEESGELSLVLTIGQRLYDSNQLAEARYYLKSGLAKTERESFESAVIYRLLGNIALKESDFSEAESYYNRALEFDPLSETLHVNLGSLFVQNQKYNQAMYYYTKAIQINSSCVKAWIGLAIVNRGKGEQDLAWANLNRALDLDSDSLTAIHICVDWAIQEENYYRALPWVMKYVANNPSNIEIKYTLAGMLFHLRRFSEARKNLHEILEFSPGWLKAIELIELIRLEGVAIDKMD
ncbi:MAG: hypothetical protein COT74_03800 [Bdellovibrionales bacterium CG10_big_fil_rev_8_21_14_0_10_45_34]|nr:MAG: hypothetical protein COT74_03800 [Bdellovibrionales bacterium CG10_big_fil_rev_8_21_14_0_10_45_34]